MLWTIRGLFVVGTGLLLTGVWLVYPPLAPIAAGGLCVWVALDLSNTPRPKP
jgi:hypothetical protein